MSLAGAAILWGKRWKDFTKWRIVLFISLPMNKNNELKINYFSWEILHDVNHSDDDKLMMVIMVHETWINGNFVVYYTGICAGFVVKSGD